MRKTKVDILPPMDGVSYLMDEIYMSNLDKQGEPPFGEPVRLWIFFERIIRKQKLRFVHEFVATNEEAALAQLQEFASRSDVTLVEEKTRKPVPKKWMEKEAV